MKRQSTAPHRCTALALLALAMAASCGRPQVSGAGSGATSTGPGTGSGAMGPGGMAPPGWDPGAGGAPPPPASGVDERACAENVTRAMPVPVDLLLLVDTSDSLNAQAEAGMGTKWSLVVEAFQRFTSDPRSSGLGMGLQFFPASARGTACNAASDCPIINPRPMPSPGGGPPGLPPPATPLMRVCREQSFCVGGAVPRDRFVPCIRSAVSCPAGATCTPGGLCAVSRRDCAAIGQPCPGGIAGDICQASSTGKICDGGDSCDPGDYQHPVVPIADLPGNQMPLGTAIGARRPSGFTSMGPAIKGALAHLQKWQMDHPDRKAALVLTTDGLPIICVPYDVPGIAAEIAAARMGTASIPTFAIGVFGAMDLGRGRMAMQAFATAGGTGTPFVIEAGGDVTTRLQEALAEIRGLALPCEFVIPPPVGGTRIDYGKVNVKWKGSSTPDETVPYVERADRCDATRGGWYYDVPPAARTPSRVIACEATCRQLKSDSGGTVNLTFGCATRVIE
jgi:hypothetical protein